MKEQWTVKVHDRRAVEITAADSNWLNLGQLRELVRRADDLELADTALISHTPGSQHIRRHDVRIARCIVIESQL